MTATTSAFALPEHLAHKADLALVAADDVHLARVAEALDHAVAEVSARLDEVRRAPGESAGPPSTAISTSTGSPDASAPSGGSGSTSVSGESSTRTTRNRCGSAGWA